MKSNLRIVRLLGILALLGLGLGAPGMSQAQGASRTFPQTGKTVAGNFLTYWDSHGGLAQQGYPISDEMQEKSDLNGQTYGVQYFERAVFEHHPENQPPFDVLLSQLGTYRYKAKYGDAGAPDQHVSTDNPRVFSETGHTLGGKFRAYWESHGGLAQQGFPISDEFTEVSDLNHQSYTVQYFERAVFELHPENAGTPFEVLLSQLGTFQYQCKYQGGPCAGGSAAPTATPALTETPVPNPGADCSDIPASQNMTVLPTCGIAGTSFAFTGSSFLPGETVGRYYTIPGEAVHQGSSQSTADGDGQVTGVTFTTYSGDALGIYTEVFEGITSHHKAVGYFKVVASPPPPPAGCSDIPASRSMTVIPNCGVAGSVFVLTGSGFAPTEYVGRYYTLPDGSVLPGSSRSVSDGAGVVTGIRVRSVASDPTEIGVWAATFEGVTSHHKAVGYFRVLPAGPPPTPAPSAGCDTSGDKDGSAVPSSARLGDTIIFRATGFEPSEGASLWFTTPGGTVVGTRASASDLVDRQGNINLPFPIDSSFTQMPGRWAITFQGADSHHQSVIFFCVGP